MENTSNVLSSPLENIEKLEASIESKMVIMREGSSLRTSEELCLIQIQDANDLIVGDELGIGSDKGPIKLDELPDESDEDYSQILSELADEAESALHEAGYSIFHNDGYVIYKDLTDEESDYMGGY